MLRTIGDPTGPSRPDRLVAVVGDVARANHHAFTRLYRSPAPPVAAELRAALPDPAGAAAVTSATFVEVWWMARFHTAPDTDVRARITSVAARRAGQRPAEDTRATGHSAASGPPDGTRAMHDRRYELALAALLDHSCAGGRRAGRRNECTDRVGTP
jgi:RNA polymerase sigma-70 factor, ECF subfamily